VFPDDPLRHHRKDAHLNSTFGDDRFGRWAERFARSFGTSGFIIGQTVILALWVSTNVYFLPRLNTHPFDKYPFVFLNLLFSAQAAYAAPLILLAQTRQAVRDQAHAEATARHAEELALMHAQAIAANTALTEQIHALMAEVHAVTVKSTP